MLRRWRPSTQGWLRQADEIPITRLSPAPERNATLDRDHAGNRDEFRAPSSHTLTSPGLSPLDSLPLRFTLRACSCNPAVPKRSRASHPFRAHQGHTPDTAPEEARRRGTRARGDRSHPKARAARCHPYRTTHDSSARRPRGSAIGENAPHRSRPSLLGRRRYSPRARRESGTPAGETSRRRTRLATSKDRRPFPESRSHRESVLCVTPTSCASIVALIGSGPLIRSTMRALKPLEYCNGVSSLRP
jgi:hypothetical protein